MPDHIFLHYLEQAKQKTGHHDSPAANAEDTFLSRLPEKLGSSIFTSSPLELRMAGACWARSMLAISSTLICITVFAITGLCADFYKAIGIGQYVTGVLSVINAAV